jgi:hypothetical protein
MHKLEQLRVINYNNKGAIGLENSGIEETYVIGNIYGYDYYISADDNSYDIFTPIILNKFNFPAAVAFVGLRNVIPENMPLPCFNFKISDIRDDDCVNLDFYTLQFKNIFLKMDVDGDETLWLKYVSEQKLKSIKQLIITMKPEENIVGLEKLNKTHYIINLQPRDDKTTITYIRKDFVKEISYIDEIDEIDDVEDPVEPVPTVKIIEEPEILNEEITIVKSTANNKNRKNKNKNKKESPN